MAESTTITGKVKWFNIGKGYGYITDEDGKDHFVHFSNITKGRTLTALNSEDEVSFEIGSGKTGKQAVNVQLISKAVHSSTAKSE